MQKRVGFTRTEKATMMLSHETIQGLTMTGMYIMSLHLCNLLFIIILVKSVVNLIKYSLKIPGVKYFLTGHLSVESFFGQQRMQGGRCDNPTVKSFLDNTRSLRSQGSQALKPFRGNCMRKRVLSTEDVFADDTPMPKRKRSQCKTKYETQKQQ